MQSIKTFVRNNGLKMTCEQVDENKNNKGWRNANHYKCIITKGNRQMTTYFSMGYGLKGNPKIEDVINAIAIDATAMDMSYQDFCHEFGYDSYDKEPKKLYNACVKNGKSLERLVGSSEMQTLIYETERL